MRTNRQLRPATGWTRFAPALAVGAQPRAVARWEHGRRLPRVLARRRLGVIFGPCSDDIVLEHGREPVGTQEQAEPKPPAKAWGPSPR